MLLLAMNSGCCLARQHPKMTSEDKPINCVELHTTQQRQGRETSKLIVPIMQALQTKIKAKHAER